MKDCKHPIKDIHQIEDYHSSPDGYGGDSEFYSYYLECKKCKKQARIYSTGNRGGSTGVRSNDYYTLTGRSANFEEMKKMFKQNNTLFHQIIDFNGELRMMVMKNPSIDRQIRELETAIEIVEKQSREMKRKLEKLWQEKRSPK